jgi:hypothetical protein
MIKDKGLACRFIVSKFPLDAAVTERTIPTAIFETEPAIRNRFLREWTKSHQINFSSELFIREVFKFKFLIFDDGKNCSLLTGNITLIGWVVQYKK